MVVKPDTLIRRHRKGFRLFWKWKSRPRGRPQGPSNVRQLIREMALSNPTWGKERIADELLLKIGIRISPRTVRRYMPETPKGPVDPKQRWKAFVRNHAKAIIASERGHQFQDPPRLETSAGIHFKIGRVLKLAQAPG